MSNSAGSTHCGGNWAANRWRLRPTACSAISSAAPGGDFCALANAKSIPLAEEIQRDFADAVELEEIGELSVNISGCMNACGHHHVGNIGILGVDKKGEEYYQISLGGSSARQASLGKILGPGFARGEVPGVMRKLVNVYRAERNAGETFLDAYRRIGHEPFKQAVYAPDGQ